MPTICSGFILLYDRQFIFIIVFLIIYSHITDPDADTVCTIYIQIYNMYTEMVL